MKRLFVLLIFFSLVNSISPEPPIENITIWNNGRAIELNNLFYENLSEADAINITWYSPLDINGGMVVAGITPLIDNTTTYGNGTKIIVGKGHSEDHIIGKDGYSVCDAGTSPTASICDFDYDGCAETENEFHVFSVMGINLSFRNISEYVEETEVEHVLGSPYYYSPSNMIKLPENMSKELETASGKEVIKVELIGKMTFVYMINDRVKSGLDCITSYTIYEKTINFSDNFSCYASGKHMIFFVERPAVNEQWFRSNKLSIMLLSQAPVYNSKLFQNDEEVLDIHLYNFNISENYFGVKNIDSLPNDIESFMGEINVTPIPLESENNTFSYLYRFNYSYEKETGENNFSLEVNDFFLRDESIKQKIFSRQLSHGNQTETGSEAVWETTRKSVVYEKQKSGFVEMFFGMLGIIVIVLMLRFVIR